MFGHEYGLAVDILNAPTRLYVKSIYVTMSCAFGLIVS